MFSDKISSSLPHLLHIQRIIIKIRVQPFRRIRELPVVDLILICLYGFLKPRMKIFRHLAGILDTDILWQPCIQRIGKLLRRHPCLCVKNCDITQRMHTGIGTAGSDHLCLSSEEF